jgi:hypothetical protein
MAWEDFLCRRGEAGTEFNQLACREDGVRFATSLGDGLASLRDLLYHRLHEDVERLVGRDTMLMPVSEVKTQRATKLEIELDNGERCSAYGNPLWKSEWLMATD